MVRALRLQGCPKKVCHFDQPTYDVLDSLQADLAELDLARCTRRIPLQCVSLQLRLPRQLLLSLQV